MADRRNFIKNSGLALIPGIFPVIPALKTVYRPEESTAPAINFVSDGEMLTPKEYIGKLAEIDKKSSIQADSYGSGGPVEALQKKFESITGKERAIYMPTGTMANQLAIANLSGPNTKVFVQETSHVYRDEADAAQSVHGKRLIPLATGEAAFTLTQLREAINYHNNGEVFKSGLGAVSIENPVRRANGAQVPLEEIKNISVWCRENNLKLHLDGARLFLASGYSGVTVKQYASYFDTVYISLYKYFGAAGGAILCGDAGIIDKMEHQIKIFGGTMYQSWPQAAMALHYSDGFEKRFKEAAEKGNQLFASLNQLPELKIIPVSNGTNIFQVKFSDGFSTKKFSETLNSRYGIILSGFVRDGLGRIAINESILKRENSEILAAIKDSLQLAKLK